MISIDDNQKIFTINTRGKNPGDPATTVTRGEGTDHIKLNKGCTSYINPQIMKTKVKLQCLVMKDCILLGQYVSEKADNVTGTYKDGVINIYSRSLGKAFELLANVKIPKNKSARFIDIQFETVEKDGFEHPVIVIYKTFVASFENECNEDQNNMITSEEG